MKRLQLGVKLLYIATTIAKKKEKEGGSIMPKKNRERKREGEKKREGERLHIVFILCLTFII